MVPVDCSMREVLCDIGPLQEEFEDIVCSMLEDASLGYEVLDRNPSHDPFEPDIVIMDEDEWVFTVLCYYIEDAPRDGFLEIFPTTFGMRKWVEDTADRPAFLALGVGGTPSNPEVLYFDRFFHFNDPVQDMSCIRDHILNWMTPAFLDAAVRREFERIYSPS